jgi:hypothetical protein
MQVEEILRSEPDWHYAEHDTAVLFVPPKLITTCKGVTCIF